MFYRKQLTKQDQDATWKLREEEWVYDPDPIWGGIATEITEDWNEFQSADFALIQSGQYLLGGFEKLRCAFGFVYADDEMEVVLYDLQVRDDSYNEKGYYWAWEEVGRYDSVSDFADAVLTGHSYTSPDEVETVRRIEEALIDEPADDAEGGTEERTVMDAVTEYRFECICLDALLAGHYDPELPPFDSEPYVSNPQADLELRVWVDLLTYLSEGRDTEPSMRERLEAALEAGGIDGRLEKFYAELAA